MLITNSRIVVKGLGLLTKTASVGAVLSAVVGTSVHICVARAKVQLGR